MIHTLEERKILSQEFWKIDISDSSEKQDTLVFVRILQLQISWVNGHKNDLQQVLRSLIFAGKRYIYL